MCYYVVILKHNVILMCLKLINNDYNDIDDDIVHEW